MVRALRDLLENLSAYLKFFDDAITMSFFVENEKCLTKYK